MGTAPMAMARSCKGLLLPGVARAAGEEAGGVDAWLSAAG